MHKIIELKEIIIELKEINDIETIEWVNQMDEEEPEEYGRSFFRFNDFELDCLELEVYVSEGRMIRYISFCIINKLPIILYTKEHLAVSRKMIKCHYYGREPPMKITMDKDILISCQNYPYTIEEIKNYSSVSATFGNSFNRPEDCYKFWKWECYCKKSTPSYIHYWEFEDQDEILMCHFDNCYNDCCVFNKVYERFVIELFPP